MAIINKNTVRNNWKYFAAGGIALVAALTVGLTCAFFPPAIPFIAGIGVFGYAPFAALASMSVVGASFAASGIAAFISLVVCAAINTVITSANAIDNKARTQKTHITDDAHEMIVIKSNPFANPGLRATHRNKAAKENLKEPQVVDLFGDLEPTNRTTTTSRQDDLNSLNFGS